MALKDAKRQGEAAARLSRDRENLKSGWGYAERIRHLSREISDLPVGVVGDQTDEKRFRVSADLLARNAEEAKRRFKAKCRAMEENAASLERQVQVLGELERRSDEASRGLSILANAIEKAVKQSGGAGFAGNQLMLNWFDAQSLAKDCAAVRSAAKTKTEEMRRAAAEEGRRAANLRSTVKTVFGFDV